MWNLEYSISVNHNNVNAILSHNISLRKTIQTDNLIINSMKVKKYQTDLKIEFIFE